MEILWKGTVSAEFWAIFDEISVFYPVLLAFRTLTQTKESNRECYCIFSYSQYFILIYDSRIITTRDILCGCYSWFLWCLIIVPKSICQNLRGYSFCFKGYYFATMLKFVRTKLGQLLFIANAFIFDFHCQFEASKVIDIEKFLYNTFKVSAWDKFNQMYFRHKNKY